jgi:hypothetical protein
MFKTSTRDEEHLAYLGLALLLLTAMPVQLMSPTYLSYKFSASSETAPLYAQRQLLDAAADQTRRDQIIAEKEALPRTVPFGLPQPSSAGFPTESNQFASYFLAIFFIQLPALVVAFILWLGIGIFIFYWLCYVPLKACCMCCCKDACCDCCVKEKSYTPRQGAFPAVFLLMLMVVALVGVSIAQTGNEGVSPALSQLFDVLFGATGEVSGGITQASAAMIRAIERLINAGATSQSVSEGLVNGLTLTVNDVAKTVINVLNQLKLALLTADTAYRVPAIQAGLTTCIITSITAGVCAILFLIRYKVDGSSSAYRITVKLVLNLMIFSTLFSAGALWLVYAVHNTVIVLMADLCVAFKQALTGNAVGLATMKAVLPCLPPNTFKPLIDASTTGRDSSLSYLNNLTSSSAPNRQYTLTTYLAATADYASAPNPLPTRVSGTVESITLWQASLYGAVPTATAPGGWYDLETCAVFKRAYKNVYETICTTFLIVVEDMVSGLCVAGIGLTAIIFFAGMASHRFDQARFPHEKHWPNSGIAMTAAVVVAGVAGKNEERKGAPMTTTMPPPKENRLSNAAQLPCPNVACQVSLPAGAQFCGNCGQPTNWAPVAVNSQNFPPPS